LKATVFAGDAAKPDEWLPEENRAPFDRILLDVPCSATGVIRRHPDIKVLRRPADIDALARGQLRLLHGLWPWLVPGGRLLYVSCSVLRAENDRVVAAFLKEEPTAQERKIELLQRLGHPTEDHSPGAPGLQILPGEAGMDGFYYACLEKHL
jgi:16S rRNA (cytosine967-C5)-methyltransferase